MAAAKKSGQRKPSPQRQGASKAKSDKEYANDKVMWSAILFAAGILITFFAAIKGESAWLAIHNMILGLFGVAVILVPPILIYSSVMLALDKSRSAIAGKVLQGIVLVLISCAVIQIFFSGDFDKNDTLGKIIFGLYDEGRKFKGGGLFSAVLAVPLLSLFGKTGAGVIIILLAFVFVMLLANKTVVDVFRIIRNALAMMNEARPEYEEVEDFTPSPGARREEAERRKAEKQRREQERREAKSKKHKPLPEGRREKVTPNSDVPPSAAELARKNFSEYDIPISGSDSFPEPKPVPPPPPPKEDKRTQAEIEAAEIEREIAIREAQKLAQREAAAREAEKRAVNRPEPSPAPSRENEGDLVSIIRRAATGAAATADSKNAAAHDAPAPSPAPVPVPVQRAAEAAPKPVIPQLKRSGIKGSTLASNKISDDEDLDMPETTAQDIQNEIRDNIPAPAEYVIPPLELLKKSSNELNAEDAEAEMTANADTLVETLKSFGVMTRIVDIHRGPTVTRYELQPNAGVKISRITGLADDIALNLAAEGVRIQAPIPGKAAVGIEVPNKVKDIVTLRDVLDTEEFRNAESKLTFAVGKNIDGQIILGDIAKLPHVIIAGTTGSGKSVCTNGIIMSILYNASPDEVRLVLIDPKVVEFKIYDGIPHLLIPVVTDPRKAAGALAWAVQEMLKRYKLFADNNVRDLKGYNEMAAETEGAEPLPRIVIVIDELADLMMAAAGEVEDSICRLAQMARAAGMHLIIATQRPTVDVITGLIKANIPSRIALKVASGIDSRSIINETGAEKLLGNGDLLYFPTGYAKPVRVQNCFSSDKEVAAVVNFIKNGAGDVTYSDDIMKEIENSIPQPKGEKEKPQDNGKSYEGSDESVIDRAIECAVDAGSAGVSVSYFQRKLKLGYARAARIMDELEELGVVGPFEGSKPRQVLMTREMLLQRELSGNTGNISEEDIPFDE